MANSTLSLLLRHMSVTAEAPRWARQTDAELLEAYGTNRQEAAFAEIMRRHGPMVKGNGITPLLNSRLGDNTSIPYSRDFTDERQSKTTAKRSHSRR